jgi:hypothetical protein
MPRRQVHVFSAAHNLEPVEKPRGNTRYLQRASSYCPHIGSPGMAGREGQAH